MHQRALAKVDLWVPVAALTTSTASPAVDIGSAYTNVGRREFTAFVSVGAGGLSGSPTLDGEIQDNTTSGATGFAQVSGTVFTQMTTSGNQAIFVKTNKRYLRVVYTFGATTSITVNAFALLEKRFP